jgi:hypothetical protein
MPRPASILPRLLPALAFAAGGTGGAGDAGSGARCGLGGGIALLLVGLAVGRIRLLSDRDITDDLG